MPEIMKPKVSMEWDDKATLLGGRFVKVYRCADCNRQLHLELPAGIDTHIATQKGASMNIPEFYDSWRERTELQHEIERLRAERKVEHELETDILYFLCAPLVVAAVVLAPAICRAIFK